MLSLKFQSSPVHVVEVLALNENDECVQLVYMYFTSLSSLSSIVCFGRILTGRCCIWIWRLCRYLANNNLATLVPLDQRQQANCQVPSEYITCNVRNPASFRQITAVISNGLGRLAINLIINARWLPDIIIPG